MKVIHPESDLSLISKSSAQYEGRFINNFAKELTANQRNMIKTWIISDASRSARARVHHCETQD